MATQAQINANRKNAQKSTGPRTEEGKEAASQNATKHGFCSCKNVIRSESQDEYNLFHDEMIADLSPAGAMEFMFAERIVNLSWRLKRAEVFQNAVTESMADDIYDRYLDNYIRAKNQAKEGDMTLILGITIRRDFENSKILEQLLDYEKRIESSLYKAAAELRKLQKIRLEREAMDEGREKMDEKHFAKRTQFTQENRIQDTENRIGNNKDCHPSLGEDCNPGKIYEGRKTMDEGKITDNVAKQSQFAGFQPEKPNTKSETLNMEEEKM